MKKRITMYISMMIASVLIMMSCKKNSNWTILPNGVVPSAIYVTGDATVFQSEGSAAAFNVAPLDAGDFKIEKNPAVQSIYVWLKKSGSFQIAIADKEGKLTKYGQGESLTSEARVKSYKLLQDAAAFTVPQDGLYYLVYCTQVQSFYIFPAKWGIIGDATPDGGDFETPFDAPTYDPVTQEVIWKLPSVALTAKTYKFRYSGDWGYEVVWNEAGDKVKIFTDATGSGPKGANPLSSTYSILQNGGNDCTNAKAGNYEVGLKFNMFTGFFSAYLKTTTVEPPPVIPIPIPYINSGANIQGDGTMHPIPKDRTVFWTIVWFTGGGSFTITNDQNTIGQGSTAKIIGNESVYLTGTNPIPAPTASGYYIVAVNWSKDSISIQPAKVYLIGATITADPLADNDHLNWTTADPTGLFTISGKTVTSPNFTHAGNLRMYTTHRWIPEWWQAEFNIYSGKIEYRGNGGDQPAVSVMTGAHCTLDFTTGTGSIQ